MKPLEAHIHILETISKERIRTVLEKPKPKTKVGGGRWLYPELTLELNQRIMELKAQGMSNKDIAYKLEVSRQTVGKHINGQITLLKRGRPRKNGRT